jgi:hypothetical protein
MIKHKEQFQKILVIKGNDNDQCSCGTLHIFDPSIYNICKTFYSKNKKFTSSAADIQQMNLLLDILIQQQH